MPRHVQHMIEHPRHNLNNGEPLRSPARAEIVRSGRVMATAYAKQGEGMDELQERAQRLSRAYSGKVVIHDS